MEPVAVLELPTFVAVHVQIGFERCSTIKDYELKILPEYIILFHCVFDKERFEVIFWSVLHCSHIVSAEGKKKLNLMQTK